MVYSYLHIQSCALCVSRRASCPLTKLFGKAPVTLAKALAKGCGTPLRSPCQRGRRPFTKPFQSGFMALCKGLREGLDARPQGFLIPCNPPSCPFEKPFAKPFVTPTPQTLPKPYRCPSQRSWSHSPCKTGSVVIATICTLVTTNTKRTTKEVAAESRHLCILAWNKVNTVAIIAILVLHVGNGLSEHVWLDILFLAKNVHMFL